MISTLTCCPKKGLHYSPLSRDMGIYVEFKWFKSLPWGDTSAIYIDVFKYPTTLSWRDKFFWQRITMNYQWYYLVLGKLNKFENILPNEFENNHPEIKKYKISKDLKKVPDTVSFIIEPERLFFFIKEGYFRLIHKQNNFAVIEFFQPIAIINREEKSNMHKISTTTAKIIFEDYTIFVEPFYAPSEILTY